MCVRTARSQHYAARGGHADICRLLLKGHAEPHVCNKAGLAAWDVALLNGRAEVRRMFAPSTSDKDTEFWFKDGNPPPASGQYGGYDPTDTSLMPALRSVYDKKRASELLTVRATRTSMDHVPQTRRACTHCTHTCTVWLTSGMVKGRFGLGLLLATHAHM